jgi:TolC family type I secretion outer membrane protein
MKTGIGIATIAGLALSLGTAAHAESLADALATAYQNNPTLLAQRATLRATDESVAQAVSGWRPTIQATGSAGWQKSPSLFSQIAGGGASSQTLHPLQSQVSITQPIFSGFRTTNGVKQANSQVMAGRATLEATEQDVFVKTVQAYVDVIRDLAILELDTNNVTVLQRQLDATKDQFRVGELTRTDVAQAEARLSQARSERIRAQANLTASRASYKSVVGNMPGSLDPVPALPALPPTEDEALAAALQNNPTLEAALYTEEASRHAIDVAKGSLLPSLDISASRSDSRGTYRPGLSSYQDRVMAQVTIPLYQSGAEYSRVRQAKETNSHDRMQIESARRQVNQTVTDAWNTLRAARSVIESSKQAVRANEIALDGVQQEASVGSRTTLDVLNAEQELLNSRTSLVTAEHDEYVAAYSLLSAVGELTAQRLSLPVQIYDPKEHYDHVKHKWIGFGTNSDADKRSDSK